MCKCTPTMRTPFCGKGACKPPSQKAAGVDHELKSWVGLFEPLLKGEKKHDFRVMDRDFKVGDVCRLREYQPVTKEYTGRSARVRITYITSAEHAACAFSPYALHPGMAVLSVELI